MEDAIWGLVCVLMGFAPFLLIGGLVWLARGPRTDPRLTDLERHIGDLKVENMRLAGRVAALERLAQAAMNAQASAVTAPSAPLEPAGAAAPETAAPTTPIADAAISAITAPVQSAAMQASAASEGSSSTSISAEQIGSPSDSPSDSDSTSTSPSTSPSTSTSPSPSDSPSPSTATATATSTATSPSPSPSPSTSPSTSTSTSTATATSPSPSDSPSPSPPLPPSPPPPAPADDTHEEEGGLERWLGVRGAAAAGAIVLAIAGLYFFEYSIEHGLIGPEMRVVLGVLAGLACVGASEWPLRKSAPALSPWLAGAGIAVLYTATWASHGVYHLVPSWVAGALMVVVTIACAGLATFRDSLPTAVLGLIGGFVTPLALSTGEDRPIPLFSYLLLLDAGLLFLAHRQKWTSLGWLALTGTTIYQLAWLFGAMRAETGWLGLGVVLAFAVLFAAFAVRRFPESEDDLQSPLLAGASVLLPFLMAFSFAGRGVFPEHLYALGGLVLVLAAGALFVARRLHAPLVAFGAGGGSLAVIFAWVLGHTLDLASAWELVALLVLLAGLFHGAAEYTPDDVFVGGASALVLFGASTFVLVAATSGDGVMSPFAALAVATAISAARQSALPSRGWMAIGGGLVLPLSLFAVQQAAGADRTFYGALALVLVALYQVPALLPRAPEGKAFADHGAAIAATTLLLLQLASPWSDTLAVTLGSGIALTILVLLAATRLATPAHAAVALAASALLAVVTVMQGAREDMPLALGLVPMAVLLHTAWPALAGPRYRASAWAWRTAALAGPLHFFPLRTAWLRVFGAGEIGLLPVALGVVSLGALWLARTRGPDDERARRTALVWPAAITAGFVTLAIPLQLSNEWLTIGWALEGAALLWLFRRLDHAGLKWLSAALFTAVAVRLLVNPYVLGYYPRGDWRIVNWIAYTYLVPAAALIAGYVALAAVEVERLRPIERTIYPGEQPWLARTLFAGALVTIFAWINLAIFDWFASGPALSIPTEHMPARDLTISIAWALYALAMLALGVMRQSSGLRWTSLALIVVTCFKVFLYDLSHLHDLYRVAALVGLAFSLLAISLLYQRFVFRRAPAPRAPREAA